MARALGATGAPTRAHVAAGTLVRTADVGWLAAAAAVMAILCAAPYVAASLFGPADLERLGTFWFVRDFSQYQAAMREGAQSSSWLIHNRFSTEPHAAVLMYPLYVGAGKLAALLRLDPLIVFAALEWLGRLALLAALYAFAAVFTPNRSGRRLAVMLAAGTLGFGALLVPLRLVEWLTPLLPATIDIYLEINSFGLFFAGPHLMLGMALTLVVGVMYLKSIRVAGWWVVGLAAAALSLSLVHPFNLPVLLSVLVAHAAWTGRRAWPAAGVALAAAAPMLIYSLVVFQMDPFWSGTYASQNRMPSAPPWELVIDFGIVLLAAPLAWPVVRRWPWEQRRLLLLWVGLGLAWMYLPVPYQRRLAFGVQPALAVLAAVGLAWLQVWMRQRDIDTLRRRLLNDGVAALALCTSVLVYVMLLASAAHNQPAEVYLWSRSEAEAARWLGNVASGRDVVLASTEFSNPLVGSIDGRVVHGHIVASFDSDAKQALVQRFFAADTPTDERTAILTQTGTTFVALGPRERALGAESLSSQPDLALVYDRDGLQLFGVRR